MEKPENYRWRAKSPTPLSSALADMQQQIKQMVEIQQTVHTEVQKLASTITPLHAGIEANERPSSAGRMSQEVLRLYTQVSALERESATLRQRLGQAEAGNAVHDVQCAALPHPKVDPAVPDTMANTATNQTQQEEGEYGEDGEEGEEDDEDLIDKSESSVFTRLDSRAQTAKRQQVFADKNAMLERVMNAAAQPEYNVANFYHKTGFCQRIAKHQLFENLTMSIIFINSIWLAIVIDMNDACSLESAHIVFQIGEHFFCSYFVIEWIIRFGAFKVKFNIIRDAWMVFDTFLVVSMVLDTWILAIVSLVTNASDCSENESSGTVGADMLRIVKMARLARTARMMRLLRKMPELMIMIKGIAAAARSVFFTLVLLFIIIYVFSIVFRQLTDQTEVGELYFSSVIHSMVSLLMQGTLPDQKDIMLDLGDSHFLLGVLAFMFVLLSGLTVLNMLVGVLVEVVGVVATVEKEEIAASYIGECLTNALLTTRRRRSKRGQLSEVKAHLYAKGIQKNDFELLLQQEKVVKTLKSEDIDVVALADLTDYLFKDEVEMPLTKLLNLVMQMRGANTATVKDIIDLRRFILEELKKMTLIFHEITRTSSRGSKDPPIGGLNLDDAWPEPKRMPLAKQRSHPSPHGNAALLPFEPASPKKVMFADGITSSCPTNIFLPPGHVED